MDHSASAGKSTGDVTRATEAYLVEGALRIQHVDNGAVVEDNLIFLNDDKRTSPGVDYRVYNDRE